MVDPGNGVRVRPPPHLEGTRPPRLVGFTSKFINNYYAMLHILPARLTFSDHVHMEVLLQPGPTMYISCLAMSITMNNKNNIYIYIYIRPLHAPPMFASTTDSYNLNKYT